MFYEYLHPCTGCPKIDGGLKNRHHGNNQLAWRHGLFLDAPVHLFHGSRHELGHATDQVVESFASYLPPGKIGVNQVGRRVALGLHQSPDTYLFFDQCPAIGVIGIHGVIVPDSIVLPPATCGRVPNYYLHHLLGVVVTVVTEKINRSYSHKRRARSDALNSQPLCHWGV